MRSWLVLPVVAVGLVLVAGCEACREKTPEPSPSGQGENPEPPSSGQGETSEPSPSGQGETSEPSPSGQGENPEPPSSGQGETSEPSPSGQGETSEPSPSGQGENPEPPSSGQGETSEPSPSGQGETSEPSPSDRRATFHLYVPYSSNISYPSVDEMKGWDENKIGPGGVLLYPTEGSSGTRLREHYYQDTPGGKGSPPIPASSFRYVEMANSTGTPPQYGTVTVYEQLPVSASKEDTPGDLMLTKVFYYDARMHVKEGASLEFMGKTGVFQPGYWGDYKPQDGITRLWPEEAAEDYHVELFVKPKNPYGFVGNTYYTIFHKGSGPPASDFWKAAIPPTPSS